MSSVSTRKGSDAQAFLARYQSLLGRIMQLASETGAEQIWEALMQRPYLLPQPLSDTPEGVVLGRELASLGEERRELEIGVAEIDEQVRRILVARSRGAAAAPASGETPDPTVSPEHLTRLFQDFSSKRGFGFIDLGNEGLGFRIERAADIEAAAERELVEASEEAAALEAMPAAEQSESEDAADEAEPVAEEASVEAASVEAAVDDDPANGPIILKVPSPAPPAPSRAPPLFRGARTTEEWSVGGGRSRPTGETNVTSGRTLGGSRPRPTR